MSIKNKSSVVSNGNSNFTSIFDGKILIGWEMAGLFSMCRDILLLSYSFHLRTAVRTCNFLVLFAATHTVIFYWGILSAIH